MQTFFLASILCLMVAAESTSIKYVKMNQKNDIASEQLVFLIEVFKLISSVAIFTLIHLRKSETIDTERQQLVNDESRSLQILEKKSSIIWFMFPACLYSVSNNVTFAALSLMSPAMFNLLMNLKIPLTGIMAAMFLGYHITFKMWISFFTLFCGSAIASMKWDESGINLNISFYGLLLMTVYASCSAGGAIFMEYVTKTRFGKEDIFLQNIKFCVCSMICNTIVMIIRGNIPFSQLEPLHLLSVTTLGLCGLMTSAVIKYSGSITKTFSTSIAMFFSALFGYVILHQILNRNFYVGATISALSVNLYIYEKYKVRNSVIIETETVVV